MSLTCLLELFMLDYTSVFLFFFSNAKRETKNEEKKKRKVKKKRIFDEEIRHRAEYESRCTCLEKDNRLLKQSLRQFRNQSLARRSRTNSCIYSTIMSICKDKKGAIIAKFRKAVPSFKYTDDLHGKTIGSGAFGTVKLGYIVSMQQRAAIKSFCDKSLNQHILAEGLVYSEMSGNVNFPLFYGMLDNRCLITEYVSSSESLKIQLSEQNYSANSKEFCLGMVRAIYSLHLKGIKYTTISTAITY